MKLRFLCVLAFAAILAMPALAQRKLGTFPPQVYTAKTIVILNDTHTDGVEEGATEILKRWGHFTIIDDLDSADIVLTFSKKREHSGSSTSTPAKDNQQASESMSLSFGSSITMEATLKGSTVPFFTSHTDDSKKKAGSKCALDFQSAYQSNR